MDLQSLPPNTLTEFQEIDARLIKLRELLLIKRAHLQVRDEAVVQLSKQREELRQEIFEIEDRILGTLAGIIARYSAAERRMPNANFMRLVDDDAKPNPFAAQFAAAGKGSET
jgi:hypothetical protein